jgi:nucleoside-diphosphate-sugar epimerase
MIRPPATVAELEDLLSTPTPGVAEDLAALDGDILVLGAGGKIGPTLARMARRAAGDDRRVIAASRFSDAAQRDLLEEAGVETQAVDLLDPDGLDALPDAENVLYLAGRKFGTQGSEPQTWAVNAHGAGLAARRFAGSRVVVYSTGNVYPLSPVRRGGPSEEAPVGPIGEYAQSCLARERLFEDAAARHGTRVLLYRLNYAIDLRYGVLLEIGAAVHEGRPVDVTMGSVNVIWQRDANAYALRSLLQCAEPAVTLNVSGPETVSVRWLAERFGVLFGREPRIEGEEADTALLTNAARAHQLFGYPTVSLRTMIDWTAGWIADGGARLGKATRFQEREGAF